MVCAGAITGASDIVAKAQKNLAPKANKRALSMPEFSVAVARIEGSETLRASGIFDVCSG
jgi:hypothetical protein